MLQVMIIDGNAERAQELETMLEQGFDDLEVRFADEMDGIRRRLTLVEVDAVVCTLAVPDATPRQLVVELAKVSNTPPIIALSPNGDDDQAAEIITAGAHDYIELDELSPERLVRSVKIALARNQSAGSGGSGATDESIVELTGLRPSTSLITSGQWDRVRSGEIAPGVDVLGAVGRFTEMMLTKNPQEPYEERVERSLGSVGLLIDAVRLSLWRFEPSSREAIIFGSWNHPGHTIGDVLSIERAPYTLFSEDHSNCIKLGGALELHHSEMTEPMQRVADVLGTRNMLIVPVTVRGELWGAITASERSEKKRRWGGTIQLLMRTIARVAVTVHRREVFDRENSDNQIHALLGKLDEVVFETDASGAFTMLSGAWERLTHQPVADAIGKPLLTFVDTRDHAQLVDSLVPVSLGQHESTRVAIRLVAGGDEPVWAELSASRKSDSGLMGTITIAARPEQAEREGAGRALRAAARSVMSAHTGLVSAAHSAMSAPSHPRAFESLMRSIDSLDELCATMGTIANEIERGAGPLRQELEELS